MALTELLNKSVSYQANSWSAISKEQTINEVLSEIKSDQYKNEIQILRSFLQNGDKEKYDIYKKRLPGITFCGTFNERRKKNLLKQYNHFIVLDIDKLDAAELERTENLLKNDEFVFSYWRSPSDKGIKE